MYKGGRKENFVKCKHTYTQDIKEKQSTICGRKRIQTQSFEFRVQSVHIMHVETPGRKDTTSYGGCAARNEAYSQGIDNDKDIETLA